MSEDKLKNVMHQLFKTIKYVSSRGIVHRDLKSENICLHLNDNFEIKVIVVDFGFGIEYKNKSMYAGSAIYSAPELIHYVSAEYGGGDCDDLIKYEPSSDIWSLGILLFEAFCGELPFKTLKEIDIGSFNFNNSKWLNVSDGPKDIIRRILIKDPHSRITIDEILDHQWFK